MKKFLLTSTLLVASAGMAAADVKVSGYGRFGLDYYSGVGAGFRKSIINARLRMNIDGSVETDSGVKFGGRFRLQWDEGSATGGLNAGMMYASYEGMRLEVGNANTAYDSAALMYNSEIGYLDRGAGDPSGSYFAYSSGALPTADYMGIFFSYSVGDLNARVSYATPDQYVSSLPVGTAEEYGLSMDYKFGAITVSAAAAWNGAGIDGNDLWFLGAEYAINPNANAGLLYFDNGDGGVPGAGNRTITLYGNYTMGAITYKGYIANNDAAGNLSDTAFGLGIDYDLGGARLAGDIHRDYAEETVAGVGVRFDF